MMQRIYVNIILTSSCLKLSVVRWTWHTNGNSIGQLQSNSIGQLQSNSIGQLQSNGLELTSNSAAVMAIASESLLARAELMLPNPDLM